MPAEQGTTQPRSPLDDNPFQYIMPNETALGVIADLRERFYDLWQHIQENVPPSRERSIAITNLETTAMWTIKAAVGRIP